MTSLPVESKTERVVRALERVGFVRQGRRKGTSHERLKRPGPKGTVVVKHPTMRIGLLKRCIRDAGMTNQQFIDLY